MSTIRLTTTITTNPDMKGPMFYCGPGSSSFDLHAYCEAYGLNPHDIDPEDVHVAQDRATQLSGGEWLEVSYSIE